ncbi:type II CAAX prenyl endopeptidase Rce1 family protein [Neobacillus sp. NPDC093127]|uniref:CPBP family glutamic-type intramembrane protease n=1 Tax=Neobacillus sp. NPDC093127 TaxID=3364296 RepID=UPI00382BB8DD
MAIIKRIFLFSVVLFFFMFLLLYLNEKLELGMNDTHVELMVTPFTVFMYLLFVFPNLRKDFFKRFWAKDNLTYSICFPILVSIFLVFLINIFRLVPLMFGSGSVVGVGKGQYIEEADLSLLGGLLFHAFFPTFSEEFLFRYLCYGGLFVFFTYTILQKPGNDNSQRTTKFERCVDWFRTKLFVEKNKYFVLSWLLIITTWFAMIHEPDITNFYGYFIPGLVFGIFFLKYGFLSAWLSHASFNALSGVAWTIILNVSSANGII